ncbi:hypothetical protein jhhlp_007963 [Lomentospora prolificans]|uniref:Copper-fist domain-containing protein n=1 Tax=Lomentospora prolificans TaxID=41688 RepID=A0A2N3MZU4_9PEZI|nr:hypothetical protein jhhlp_007963 [Lomentospora prolificans]
MIIDGEKFACGACIRGHRTAQCQHTVGKIGHFNGSVRRVDRSPNAAIVELFGSRIRFIQNANVA